MTSDRRVPPTFPVRLVSTLAVSFTIVATAPALAGIDAPPTSVPATQPVVTDAALDAALDATRNAMSGPEFDATLRSVASRFPLVTVSTEPGRSVWNKLTLNRRGKWIDAIRFRVPEGEPRDLLWALISNETRYEWYIFAVDAQPMQGFARNWYYKPQDILGERTPAGAKDLMLQTLPASSLRPGAEYVIWLKFRHGRPRPTHVAISLLPAAADPASIDAPQHVVRALGLSRIGDPIALTALELTPATQPSAARKSKTP